MPINHSFSITMCNFKLVAKLAIFIFILTVIAAALILGIVGPIVQGFVTELQEDFPITPEEVIEHPLNSIKSVVSFFGNYISTHTHFVTTRMLFALLLIMGIKFFLQLPMLPLAKIMHSKMSTGFDIGLINAFVSTIGENLLFSSITALVFTILDGAITIATVYMAVWLLKVFGLVGITISLFVLILLLTIRMSLFCQWLPELVKSKSRNIFKALALSFKPATKNFRKNAICIMVINIALYACAATTAIWTVGLLPILLLPTFMVLYTALGQTLSFSYHQQKYFVDNGTTIYDPAKKY